MFVVLKWQCFCKRRRQEQEPNKTQNIPIKVLQQPTDKVQPRWSNQTKWMIKADVPINKQMNERASGWTDEMNEMSWWQRKGTEVRERKGQKRCNASQSQQERFNARTFGCPCESIMVDCCVVATAWAYATTGVSWWCADVVERSVDGQGAIWRAHENLAT